MDLTSRKFWGGIVACFIATAALVVKIFWDKGDITFTAWGVFVAGIFVTYCTANVVEGKSDDTKANA